MQAFSNKYRLHTLEPLIGGSSIGSQSWVSSCTCKTSDLDFAVKQIFWKGPGPGHVSDVEKTDDHVLDVVKGLRHPKLAKVLDVFYTGHTCLMVMDLFKRSDMFTVMNKLWGRRRTFREAEARHVFRQLLEGVGYLHSCYISHLGLKLTNVLIEGSERTQGGVLYEVRISDFACGLVSPGYKSLGCGSVSNMVYLAPEISNRLLMSQKGYVGSIDLWALGVILYSLLCGGFPFASAELPLQRGSRAYTSGVFTPFDSSPSGDTLLWDQSSPLVKALIQALLTVDPRQRLSLRDCIKDAWLDPTLAPLSWIRPDLPLPESNGSSEFLCTHPKPSVYASCPFSSIPKERSVGIANN